jgi:hypothetical protein
LLNLSNVFSRRSRREIGCHAADPNFLELILAREKGGTLRAPADSITRKLVQVQGQAGLMCLRRRKKTLCQASNGTNGDTQLHPVNAILARSLIIAEGSVERVTGAQGHLISINASVPNGRMQDFLTLATRSEKPVLSGPVKIKAKLILPPWQGTRAREDFTGWPI